MKTKMTNEPGPRFSETPGPGNGALPYSSEPVPYAQGPVPTGDLANIDMFALLRSLRYQWKLATVLGVLGTALAGLAAWFFVPDPPYTATATLQIKQEEPRVIFSTAESQSRFEFFQKTQIILIKSRQVLESVIKDPKIAGLKTVAEAKQQYTNPVEWLEKELTVDFPRETEILRISLNGKAPDDLETIVNAVMDTYMRVVVDQSHAERVARLESLRKLWDQKQQEMKQKRDQTNTIAKSAGSGDNRVLVMKAQLAQQHVAEIERQKAQIHYDLMRAKADLNSRKNTQEETETATGTEVDAATIDEYVEKVPEVAKAHEAYLAILAKYDRHLQVAKKKSDPAAKKALQEITEAKQAWESQAARVRPLIAQRLKSTVTGRQPNDIAHLVEQIQLYTQFEQDLQAEADSINAENKDLNEQTLDLKAEQDEYAMMGITAAKLGNEVEVTEVELKAPKRVKVIDRATVPLYRSGKRKIQVTSIASLGTLCCILVGVSFWDMRSRRINSVDQVVSQLGLRVVGALPYLPPEGSQRGSTVARSSQRDWHNLLVESVDATRAMLLYASRLGRLNVVMVTSAQSGEGKTSLASHLAASLARAGRRTILVDCDFRRPSIHRLFDLPVGPGISKVLRGEIALMDAFQPSPSHNLIILPAGQVDSQVMEAVGRGDLQAIFNDLKSQFDFVIVDSAPVLPVADTLLISQYVDATILSIMHDVSRIPLVQTTYERLTGLGVPILGAVVAGTKDQPYESNYYYYHSEEPTQASAS